MEQTTSIDAYSAALDQARSADLDELLSRARALTLNLKLRDDEAALVWELSRRVQGL